ncbi:MAG TPA: PD-(D/E)XK nuclease family protein [Myxococcota bacterium]
MAETYSHSRLANFESCPRKFRYRYVLKIAVDTESVEAFLGKRVHEVLERLYIAVGRGHVPSLPQVIQRYSQLFDDAYDAERVSIVRTENPPEHYRGLGADCLANYYRAHYPFDADETLALEERIAFDLIGDGKPRVRFQGFVDRIARARDGAIEIHDYKTSSRVPRQADLDEDRQLALYQMGLARRWGDAQPVRLVWHYLRHARTCTSTRSAGQLDALREQMLELVMRIRAETEFEAKPSALCRWCEYRSRCPASPERDASLPTWEEELERATPADAQGAARSDQLTLPLRGDAPVAGG